jgi:hypothetical protein
MRNLAAKRPRAVLSTVDNAPGKGFDLRRYLDSHHLLGRFWANVVSGSQAATVILDFMAVPFGVVEAVPARLPLFL